MFLNVALNTFALCDVQTNPFTSDAPKGYSGIFTAPVRCSSLSIVDRPVPRWLDFFYFEKEYNPRYANMRRLRKDIRSYKNSPEPRGCRVSKQMCGCVPLGNEIKREQERVRNNRDPPEPEHIGSGLVPTHTRVE